MKLLTTLIALLLYCSINAQISSNELLGAWKMTTQTPLGDKKQNFVIEFQNDKLIGITKNGMVEITISGNQLSWENSVKTPIGKIDVWVEGLVDADGNIVGFSSPISGRMKGRKLSWVMRKE